MPKILGVKEEEDSGALSVRRQGESYISQKHSSRTYYVLADDQYDTEDEIIATPGLPQLWTFYNNGFCRSLSAKELNSVFHPMTGIWTSLWEVQARYDSNMDPSQEEDDPLLRPLIYNWSGETEDELLEQDAEDGTAVETDALEPMEITTQVAYPILEIKRWEPDPFDPNVILNYVNHVNSQTFRGAPEGTALMLPITAEEQVEKAIKYQLVTYRIKFKIKKKNGAILKDSWRAEVPHQGYQYREEPNGEPRPFEIEGNPRLARLKTARLHPGEGGMLLGKDDPLEYKFFNKFPKVNFNTLGL